VQPQLVVEVHRKLVVVEEGTVAVGVRRRYIVVVIKVVGCLRLR